MAGQTAAQKAAADKAAAGSQAPKTADQIAAEQEKAAKQATETAAAEAAAVKAPADRAAAGKAAADEADAARAAAAQKPGGAPEQTQRRTAVGYVVTGAAAVLRTDDGHERYFYRGAPVDAAAFSKDSIKHAVANGLIAKAK